MKKRIKKIYRKSKKKLVRVGRGIKKTYAKSKPYVKSAYKTTRSSIKIIKRDMKTFKGKPIKRGRKIRKIRRRAKRMSVAFDKRMFG